MSDREIRDLVTRLKSIEGHVRGIERMVEEGQYCVDIVNQILAVERALKKVSGLMLERHLHCCVTRVIQSDDSGARDKVLDELMEVFGANGRA